MTKKSRIFFARVALVFFISSTIVPTLSYAFAPLIGGAIRIGSLVMKSGPFRDSAQNVAMNTALSVGSLVWAMGINRTDGTNTRDDWLYTTNAPRAPTATEAAAGFTAGSPSLVPPGTSNSFSRYGITSQGIPNSYPTPQDACDTWYSGGTRTHAVSLSGGIHYCTIIYNGSTVAGPVEITVGNVCSAGYTYSGGTCTLSNASAVPRPVDSVCPIVRNGASYAVDSTDPDCSNGQQPTLTTDGSGVSVWHWVDNEGFTIDIATNPDGTGRIVYRQPDASTNTTKTRTIDLAAPADAASPPRISGVGDSVVAGTGTQASSAPLAAPPIQLPTDYARQGEAATAADRIIAAEEARMGTAPAPDTVPNTQIPVTVTSIPFSSNAVCPAPVTFDVNMSSIGFAHNYSVSYGPMCDLMSYMRPLFLMFGAIACAYIFIGGLKS